LEIFCKSQKYYVSLKRRCLQLDLGGDTDAILKILNSKETLLSGEQRAATLHTGSLPNKLAIEKDYCQNLQAVAT